MAYCLRSLVQTLEQVLHPEQHYKTWVLDPANIPQIQSLLENATFLRDFFDTTSPLLQYSIESLEDQIMEAAGKAEDTLELHITDQILSNPEGQSFVISPPDLGEVLKVFEVAKQELIKVKAAGQRWGDVSLPVSSTHYPDSKNMVVGVEEDLNQLRDRLTSEASELKVIPIVGMGGSGKTTLARILYDEHSYGRQSHFDLCAWVTVSRTYDPKTILQTLVDLVAKSLNVMPQQEKADLILTLYKTLFGRRYLIVLDDIWSRQAWDDFQRAFPHNDNRSRIILTTRDNTVANYVDPNSHQMHFLSEDDSWELLRRKVFLGERQSYLQEFEDVGKRIALHCGGLPLALQVIGGLLSQYEKSLNFWEDVAYNVSSTIAETNHQFSGIFSSSFVNLPHYLKPCFLYMGSFPEDYVIRSTTIIRMWIAQGFLYPIPNQSLEEAAETHLRALVDRNLIFVRERRNGKAKSYGIHDLLRDLCLKKAQEKKFICSEDLETGIIHDDTLFFHRVLVQLSNDEKEYAIRLARAFLMTNGYVSEHWFVSLVFRGLPSSISEVHKSFIQLLNLRYLSLLFKHNTQFAIPRAVFVLRNLQTLIVDNLESIMILEDLPQLRHLRFTVLVQKSYEGSFSVHESLQSLSFIPFETLSRLLGKLPNLIKLGIQGHHSKDNVDWIQGHHSIDNIDLTGFHNLQTLHYNRGYTPDAGYNFSNENMFPHSIKILSFSSYVINQTLLDAIGVLPNLQILKFNFIHFWNYTWEPSENGFHHLQYLKFQNSELKNWSATESHFPALRHLVFDKCPLTTEIPVEIGEIDTLEIIEVNDCKSSVFESVKRILEEQIEFGNYSLELRLGRSYEEQEGEEKDIEAKVQNNALKLCSYTFRITTRFPQYLERLTLYLCVFNETSLHALGILPELEYLKLKNCYFESSTWEPLEGGFGNLRSLKISCDKLENWLATELHFPVLQRLVLKQCYRLDEIPNRIGGIETLESIDVARCHNGVFDSALRILEEQHQLGNTLLQVRFVEEVLPHS